MAPIAECISCGQKSENFDSDKQAEEWARSHTNEEWKKAGFPGILKQEHKRYKITGRRPGEPYGYDATSHCFVYRGQEEAKKFNLG